MLERVQISLDHSSRRLPDWALSTDALGNARAISALAPDRHRRNGQPGRWNPSRP